MCRQAAALRARALAAHQLAAHQLAAHRRAAHQLAALIASMPYCRLLPGLLPRAVPERVYSALWAGGLGCALCAAAPQPCGLVGAHVADRVGQMVLRKEWLLNHLRGSQHDQTLRERIELLVGASLNPITQS